MADPLNIVVSVVNGILALVKEAKTNQEGCQLLASLAEQTLSTLTQVENRELTDPLMTTALELINDALNDAHKAIEECCKSNFFVAMVNREQYASSLKQAAVKLEHALSQVSVASVGMTADIQSELVALSDHIRKAKFNERAEIAHQSKALKDELEKAFFKTGQGTEEVKSLIRGMMQEHSSTAEEMKKELVTLKAYANSAHVAKEKQHEFELNQVIAVLSESLEDATGEEKISQDLKDCLCCPITKEIMRDPVVLKESGMIYDRSSIEEWFRRGHHHDPLTNVELISRDFFPCMALKGTCQRLLEESGASSSVVENPQIEESKTQLIVPGLYEGHGKLMIGSKIVYVSQVLILQPRGVALGCSLYELENKLSRNNVLEIGVGKWENESLQLSFEDDRYLYNGEVDLGITDRHLGMKWTGKVSGDDEEEEQHDFMFVCSAPHVSRSIWVRAGILQIEGSIVSPWNNVKYNSKLVLALEADSTLVGCMWFESDSSQSNSIGRITGGSWDTDGSVSFKVEFSQTDKAVSPRNDPTNNFDCFKISGALLQDGQVDFPSFTAMVVNATRYGTSPIDQSSYVPLKDVKVVEYSYVREATTPWHRFVPGPRDMFHISEGEYFIRADLNKGGDLRPYYLHVHSASTDFIPSPDTHAEWTIANPQQGYDQWQYAEIWKVDKQIQSNQCRLSIIETHQSGRDVNEVDQIGKSLTMWRSVDTNKNRGDAYLCARKISRIEEQPVWSLKKRNGRLHLVLEGAHNPSIGENAEYFASRPKSKRDHRNWLSLYAPLTQDVKQALPISLEQAQY